MNYLIKTGRGNEKSDLIQKINNICHYVDSIMNEDELYKSLVTCIQKNLDYDHVALYLVNNKQKKINLKAISGIYENYTPSNQQLDFYTGIVGQVIKNRKTILSNNTSQNPHFYNSTPQITPTQSELCVPITISDQIIGAINIESREIMNFNQDDINSLEVLANHVGTAIHNSQLYEEVQRYNKRLYDILSSMGQGLVVLDNNVALRWANKTSVKYFGSDIVGKLCYDSFCSKKICDTICQAKITLNTGKIVKRMIQLNDGKYYNVTSAPIKKVAGSTKQVLEMFDDVTSGIELQQKLDDTKKQLEQTKYFAVIGELTTSIAHEIRNPLNAISNAISILDNVLPVEDDHAQILNIVKEESNRLNKIISKYIRYGKFPDLSMSRNNILKTIEDTVVLFKLDKKISDRIKFTTKFESNIPDLLYDKESIKQVFWNLLINSVSAIKGKGTINISVKTNKCFVNIDIKDNGIGIPENKINKIFEQFYTIKSQGTGIGLAIVRRIIDMHDWNIQVKSMFGSWTKFLIQAPIR